MLSRDRRSAVLLAVATAALAAGTLSACSSLIPTTPPPTTGAPAPRAPSPTSEQIALNCDLMITDADAAAFTPPLHPIPSFVPSAGTLPSVLVQHGGQPCGWGADSAASLQVVVAVPFTSGLKAAKAAAAAGQPVDLAQVDAAYFTTSDGMGQVQIFLGSYWIDVASPSFTSADQAQTVSALVVHNLRGAGG